MADNKVVTNTKTSFDADTNADYTAATDEVAGVDYQFVKLTDPTLGSTSGIGVAANPMHVQGTVTATVDTSALATAANQTTIIGHVDGIEGALTTLNAKDFATQTTLAAVLTELGQKTEPADQQHVIVDSGSVTVGGTVAVTQSGTWDEVGINDSGNSITVDNAALSVVGGGTEATALRVTIASDSTGVLSIDDNGASLTVDGTVAVTQSGTWDEVGINDSGNSITVDNAGTFVVQENGAALTALQLIDDTVATLGTTTYTETTTKGLTIGAVRRDADTTLVGTTNEIGPLQMDANGRLKVEVFDGGDSHTVDFAAATNDISAAYEASSVTKASAGTLWGFSGYNSKTSDQFILFFNSTTVPADATTAVVVWKVAALSPFSLDFGVKGNTFATGIAWSNSSTAPTKTIGSADIFMEVRYT